jgi:plastocyanin
MSSVGRVAFIVLLVLGAITGILSYYLFAKFTPTPGIINSVDRTDLAPTESATQNNDDKNKQVSVVDESKFTTRAAVVILKGSSIQGNPSFNPDVVKAKTNALVIWTNDDTVPHSATSGSGPTDPNVGKLFDSDILNSGQKYSIPASKIGLGEHPYHCKIHPYMTGKITVG